MAATQYAAISDDFLLDVQLFGDLLQWFGPLSASSFLPSVVNTLRKDWFHGNLSGQQSIARLSGHPPGSYLFRFSATDPGSYAITAVNRTGEFSHYRVYHRPTLKYLLGKVECGSLDEVLYRFKRDLFLQTPLRPTPYEHLFRPSHPPPAAMPVNRYTPFADSDSD